MRLARLLLVAAACVLQACVAIQTYPGPMRPDDQISKIVPNIGLYGLVGKEIAVVYFDGREVSEPYAVMEVLPGRHIIGLRYDGTTAMIGATNVRPCFVVIDAEAGVNFHVNGEYLLAKDEWHCWATNRKTEVRIPGVFLESGLPPLEELPALMDAIVAKQAGTATGATDVWVNTVLGPVGREKKSGER